MEVVLEKQVTQSISLVPLNDASSSLARQAFAIYEVSFPVAERDPLENLVELIEHSGQEFADGETVFRFWLGVAEGEVLALSAYTYHRRRRLGFLWYMATLRTARSQGIGSWMFARTLEMLRQEDQELPIGLCWEVERPSAFTDLQERQFAERRIRFYQRNGSLLFPEIDLLTPALEDGLPDVSYHLMFYPLENQAAVTPQRIRSLIDVILLDSYGVEPDSIYYQRAVATLSPSQAAGSG